MSANDVNPPDGVPLISLMSVLESCIQSAYGDLTELITTLKSKSDAEKKDALFKYSETTRQRFLRLLAVMKWTRRAEDVYSAWNIMRFLDEQYRLYTDSADNLALYHQTLDIARVPPYAVTTAVDVLATGSFHRLPRILDELVPRGDLSADEQQGVLTRLNDVIMARLVQTPVPSCFSFVRIGHGRLRLIVTGEFDAVLTLSMMDGRDQPVWRLLDLQLSMFSRNAASSTLDPVQIVASQRERLIKIAQAKLLASETPLLDLFDILHQFSLSIQLETLSQQCKRLEIDRWHDQVRIDYTPGRELVLHYWKRYQMQLISFKRFHAQQLHQRRLLGTTELAEPVSSATSSAISANEVCVRISVDPHDPRKPLLLTQLPALYTNNSGPETLVSLWGLTPASSDDTCITDRGLLLNIEAIFERVLHLQARHRIEQMASLLWSCSNLLENPRNDVTILEDQTSLNGTVLRVHYRRRSIADATRSEVLGEILKIRVDCRTGALLWNVIGHDDLLELLNGNLSKLSSSKPLDLPLFSGDDTTSPAPPICYVVEQLLIRSKKHDLEMVALMTGLAATPIPPPAGYANLFAIPSLTTAFFACGDIEELSMKSRVSWQDVSAGPYALVLMPRRVGADPIIHELAAKRKSTFSHVGRRSLRLAAGMLLADCLRQIPNAQVRMVDRDDDFDVEETCRSVLVSVNAKDDSIESFLFQKVVAMDAAIGLCGSSWEWQLHIGISYDGKTRENLVFKYHGAPLSPMPFLIDWRHKARSVWLLEQAQRLVSINHRVVKSGAEVCWAIPNSELSVIVRCNKENGQFEVVPEHIVEPLVLSWFGFVSQDFNKTLSLTKLFQLLEDLWPPLTQLRNLVAAPSPCCTSLTAQSTHVFNVSFRYGHSVLACSIVPEKKMCLISDALDVQYPFKVLASLKNSSKSVSIPYANLATIFGGLEKTVCYDWLYTQLSQPFFATAFPGMKLSWSSESSKAVFVLSLGPNHHVQFTRQPSTNQSVPPVTILLKDFPGAPLDMLFNNEVLGASQSTFRNALLAFLRLVSLPLDQLQVILECIEMEYVRLMLVVPEAAPITLEGGVWYLPPIGECAFIWEAPTLRCLFEIAKKSSHETVPLATNFSSTRGGVEIWRPADRQQVLSTELEEVVARAGTLPNALRSLIPFF